MKTDLFFYPQITQIYTDFLGTLNNQLPGTPEPFGEGGSTINYFAMQTFFASVKKRSASSPPSRPTPLAFMPTLLPL